MMQETLSKNIIDGCAGYLYNRAFGTIRYSRKGRDVMVCEYDGYYRDWHNLSGYEGISGLETVLKASFPKSLYNGRSPAHNEVLRRVLTGIGAPIEELSDMGKVIPKTCVALYSDTRLCEEKPIKVKYKPNGLIDKMKHSLKRQPTYEEKLRKVPVSMIDIASVYSEDKAFAMLFSTNDNYQAASGSWGTGVTGTLVASWDVMQQIALYIQEQPENFKVLLKALFPEKGSLNLSLPYDKMFLIKHNKDKGFQTVVSRSDMLGRSDHNTTKIG